MAMFSRSSRSDDSAVLGLLADDAPRVLAGASLDRHERVIFVPVDGGRARVSIDQIVEHALHRTEPARPETVRRWLVDVASQLSSTTATGPSRDIPPAESLRLQVTPAWVPDQRATVAGSPVPTCFDALVVHATDDGRVHYMQQRHADNFGGELEAATLATGQTIRAELLDVDVRDHDTGNYLLRMIAKDHCPYVTTTLMSLERFLPFPAADALVITPRYSSIALMPVTTTSEIGRAAQLRDITASLAQQAQDPCSPDVYWWHTGTFWQLDFDEDGTVSLPPELGPAVAHLP